MMRMVPQKDNNVQQSASSLLKVKFMAVLIGGRNLQQAVNVHA